MKNNDSSDKLVIAVRRDIKLSPGKMAAQVGHASVECAFLAQKKSKKWFKRWKRTGAKKVVVWVENMDALQELIHEAEGAKLVHYLVVDAGLTQVPPGTPTCLGIGPGPSPIVDSITGHLKLV